MILAFDFEHNYNSAGWVFLDYRADAENLSPNNVIFGHNMYYSGVMFGTLNKYERYTKNVVCNLCAKAIMGMPLNLKQNCRFSWVDIRDVSMAISYIFNYDIKRFDYNIAIEQSYTLYEIAKLICHLAQINERITFEKEGMNKEYTCETTCSRRDIPIRMTSISDSILDIYQYYLSIKDSIQMSSIDSRWN